MENVHDIVKSFSQCIFDLEIKPNDLLLSGIIDVHYITTHHKKLKNTFQSKKLWDLLDEKFVYYEVTKILAEFIDKYVEEEIEIPECNNNKEKLLYRSVRLLLDHMYVFIFLIFW